MLPRLLEFVKQFLFNSFMMGLVNATSEYSVANILPERPNPHCISSEIKRMPFRLLSHVAFA